MKRKVKTLNHTWLNTPRIQAKRDNANRKRIADGTSFRTRWARIQRGDYRTSAHTGRCEKCKAPTNWEVNCIGRWAYWCGCS